MPFTGCPERHAVTRWRAHLTVSGDAVWVSSGRGRGAVHMPMTPTQAQQLMDVLADVLDEYERRQITEES